MPRVGSAAAAESGTEGEVIFKRRWGGRRCVGERRCCCEFVADPCRSSRLDPVWQRPTTVWCVPSSFLPRPDSMHTSRSFSRAGGLALLLASTALAVDVGAQTLDSVTVAGMRWRTVGRICPHTERAKRWLDTQGNDLHRYGIWE